MKTLKAINSDEVFSKVIERIQSEDARHDLHELSQLACDYHQSQGYLVLEGMEGLKEACAQHGAFTDEADLTELNDAFLEACGFDKHREPVSIYWGGNGNCTWFTKFCAEKDESMCEALERWTAAAWADLEEQASWES